MNEQKNSVNKKSKVESFELTLVASDGEIPVSVRLRQALKTLLRAYGFKCVSIAAKGESTAE